LIFRLFRTLPVSQRLRFLCLIIPVGDSRHDALNRKKWAYL
jgi:hypothetical protein